MGDRIKVTRGGNTRGITHAARGITHAARGITHAKLGVIQKEILVELRSRGYWFSYVGQQIRSDRMLKKYNPSETRDVLDSLVRRGEVTKDSHGVYRPAKGLLGW